MNQKYTDSLLLWYQNNARNLPWKNELDAYSTWLSEIIMQQTRVEQGTSYYLKFKKNYPTIQDLAAADLSEVIKLWEGLGYYSRARNLHYTAQHIAEKLNGEFPNTYEGIKKLKGVGPYTAAAISSFAFNIPKAAIDGFGALVCKPKKPLCEQCPLQETCSAFREKTISLLPVKSKSLKKTNRHFHYLFLKSKSHTWIREREKDFWRHLFEFPLIEMSEQLSPDQILIEAQKQELLPASFKVLKATEGLKQTLSHRYVHATILEIEVAANFSPKGYTKTPLKELDSQPFPRLLFNYLQENVLS